MENNFLAWLISIFMPLFGEKGKRYGWDYQYKTGCWKYLSEKDPEVIAIAEGLAQGDKIVSLGCGADDIIFKLNPQVYSSYLGIDISKVAIEQARHNANKLGLKNCHFCVDNIANWEGDKDITLIIIQESLYYLNLSERRELLKRCFDSLKDNGSILVTVHSRYKHKKSLDICRNAGKVVKEINKGEATYLVLQPDHT